MADLFVFNAQSIPTAIEFQKKTGAHRIRKAPKIAPSRSPEIDYFRSLNKLLADIGSQLSQSVLPHLAAIVDDSPKELRQKQDAGEVLEQVIGNFRIAFQARAPISMITGKVAAETAKKNKKQQDRIVDVVLGIRPELSEPWLQGLMDQFSKSNAKLIGKVTGDFIDRVEQRVGDRVRDGMRASEIAKEIERDFIKTQGIEAKKARKRAKLIARDQVASFQADVTRVRQEQLGVQRYVWRTAIDERVRDTHRAREGEIFEWGKPIEKQLRKKGMKVDTIDGHPGKPINCRCYAEPVLQDLIPDAPEI